MDELVFFLEEESAKVMLQSIVAKLQLEQQYVATRYIVFEGKQHLDQNLEHKLRGYVNPQARFIVLRDQDGSDCKTLKSKLSAICADSERCRSAFRTDVDHDSEVMPISVPNRSRSLLRL